MERQQLIELITQEVCKVLNEFQVSSTVNEQPESALSDCKDEDLMDIASSEYKETIVLDGCKDPHALKLLRKATSARIGIGKAGARINTKTYLALRADHAMAKDAVLRSVDESILKRMNLFQIKSMCNDIDQHLTRPDLGRRLDEETLTALKTKCVKSPQVQIYVSDGLSSVAIDENVSDILPVMTEGLKANGITIGTPFFMKYGRVAAMDAVSEAVDAEVTCVLLGERPGLATAKSMSAYIAYRATVGMPESRRTVISNIHTDGIQPIEAGAYAVDIIMKILKEKKSGVDLKL
jgi:ethanolamine ammonia-lyase small subunit